MSENSNDNDLEKNESESDLNDLLDDDLSTAGNQTFEGGLENNISQTSTVGLAGLTGFERDQDVLDHISKDGANDDVQTPDARNLQATEIEDAVIQDASASTLSQDDAQRTNAQQQTVVKDDEYIGNSASADAAHVDDIADTSVNFTKADLSTSQFTVPSEAQESKMGEEEVEEDAEEESPPPPKELPAFDLSAEISENASAGTQLGDLPAVDRAGDALSYAITDATGQPVDHPAFVIINNQVQVRDGATLDFEAAPMQELFIKVTNIEGTSRIDSFEIDLTDINEGPQDISLSNAALAENAAGAAVGTLSTTDPDAGDTHSYTVDDARFEVVGGTLKLKDGISLDHESAGTIDVTVTSTDADGAALSETFTVNVTDINEGPQDISLSNAALAENAAGAAVGTLSTTDPDAGDTHSYTVDDARFEVVGGTLKLKDGISLDHESAGTIDVTVTSTDADGAALSETFSIDVTNVNEAATLDLNMVALDAPDDASIAKMAFGAVTIENAGQSEAVHGEGAGETALWSNVGTFQGMAFDVRATVVETNTSGYYDSFFRTSGDNAYVLTNAGQTTVEYKFYMAGTDEELIINGSYLIDDLDGGSANEGFSVDLEEVDAYGVERDGDIIETTVGDTTKDFRGDGYSNSGDSEHAVAFNASGTKGFTVTYSADSNGRGFMLDGNWNDGYFDDLEVTDTNLNHADVFTEGSAGTHVASEQVSVSDVDGATLDAATIVLTNAQNGDVLSVGDLPDGIAATVDTGTEGEITVTLTGTASHADYEAAMRQVMFENPNDDLASIPRTIEFTVDDGGSISDPATTTIYVNEIGDDGVFQDTGSELLNDVLTGNANDNLLRGLGGDDQLHGEAGNDTLIGGTGNDTMTGGEGNDSFVLSAMQGDDVVSGGTGTAWTDTLELGGVSSIPFGGTNFEGVGWTVVLDEGSSIEGGSVGQLDLSEDASGTVLFDDGGSIDFDGIEKITW